MKQNTHLFAQVEISPGRGGSSSMPRSTPRRRSAIARVPPIRSTSSVSRSSAAWNWKSIASRNAWPLIASTRSPRLSPTDAAGVRGRTSATVTPAASSLSPEHWLIGRLALRRVGRVQIAHALHDVLESRDDRERRREPHHGARHDRHAEIPREQTAENGEDLEEGRRLADERRPGIDPAAD